MFKKHAFKIERIGWKQSYEILRKKAMEQELSLSGLILSLSIAFFVVSMAATFLNLAFHSLEESLQQNQRLINGGQLLETGNIAKIFIKQASAAELDIKAQPAKDTLYVSLEAGQQATQTIVFKNIGKDSWRPSQISFQTGASLKRISRLYKNSWLRFYEPVSLPKEVKAGQSVSISFPISIPSDIEGTIQEDFQLVYNEKPIKGSLVRLFITINKPKTITNLPVVTPPTNITQNVNPPITNNAPAPSTQSSSVVSTNEPIIRIGLFASAAAQRITFNTVFDVYSGSEIIISSIVPTGVVIASFDPTSKKYLVNYGSINKTVLLPLRFVPREKTGVATLLDYRNGPAWNTAASDNRFRNIIEMRYTEPAKKVWFINELPIETYLKGLAETTNASPVEFQKVMVTAARSYAMYHYNRGLTFGLTDASTKHADDHFHIDAYYDQVYRGYNSELRMPRLAAAVDATRGTTITYENKIVVTPYFSNSDGRTRDWTEVWGGSAVPWLKSVSVPYDVGKTLFGHGVGMSARGALLMVNEGKTWDNVLKYFYTGISLAKAY